MRKKTFWTILSLLASVALSGYDYSHPTLLITYHDLQDGHSHHLLHDLQTQQDELLSGEPTTGYSSAVIDGEAEYVYFTAPNGEHQMQLFRRSLQATDRQALSSDFEHVDLLRYDTHSEKLYVRVLQKGHRNYQLACYDREKGALTVLQPDDADTSVKGYDISRATGVLYAWTVSVQEEAARLSKQHQQADEQAEPPLHRLVKFAEGAAPEEITTVELDVLDMAVSEDGDHALFTAREWLGEEAPQTIYHADLRNGHRIQVFSDGEQFGRVRLPHYAESGKGIYFVADRKQHGPVTDKDGRHVHPSAVGYYEFKTKSMREVWHRAEAEIRQINVWNR